MRVADLAVRAAVVTVAVTGLAACDAPKPSVTVFSGSASAHREALCWSRDADRPFAPEDCAITPAELSTGDASLSALADLVPRIDVVPDATIGVSVDEEVARTGWTITLNGKPLSNHLITTTYHRFSRPAAAFRRGPIEMRIFAATNDGTLTRGLWVYELNPQGLTSSGT